MQGVFGLGRDRNYLSCRRKVLLSGGNNWLVKSGLVFRHLLRDMPWNEESKRRGPGVGVHSAVGEGGGQVQWGLSGESTAGI